MTPAHLSCRELTKVYPTTAPPTVVLDGVDLDVAPGEFVAVMGASGSGKSTLLACLGGIDRPTSGTITLDGEDLSGLDDDALAGVRLTRMGFVFQQPHFLADLCVRDNVLLPALKSGRAEAGAVVDGLLERFGIAHVADHGITRVSGGQLQRAAICRALVSSPSVVFADEPTGALNSAMTDEVMAAFDEVHAAGTTIVMVTHDPICASRAERIVFLRDGQAVDEIRPGATSTDDASGRESAVVEWLRERGF